MMNLKVLVPFRVFAEINNVGSIVAETTDGFYGFLPKRLDCVAALVPGIFTYVTNADEIHYLAVDEGVMVKAGSDVFVSVCNAIKGDDLRKLHEVVKKDFMTLNENDRNMRKAMADMESVFIKDLERFQK